MSHVTHCPKCSACYEEHSEEEANNPDRRCITCTLKRQVVMQQADGTERNFGALVRQRSVEHLNLTLTYDDPGQVWWILVHADNRTCALGYSIGRREVAWNLFMGGTVDDFIEAARDTVDGSLAGSPPSTATN